MGDVIRLPVFQHRVVNTFMRTSKNISRACVSRSDKMWDQSSGRVRGSLH